MWWKLRKGIVVGENKEIGKKRGNIKNDREIEIVEVEEEEKEKNKKESSKRKKGGKKILKRLRIMGIIKIGWRKILSWKEKIKK